MASLAAKLASASALHTCLGSDKYLILVLQYPSNRLQISGALIHFSVAVGVVKSRVPGETAVFATAAMDIAEEELHALYTWVDEIPLSRPKVREQVCLCQLLPRLGNFQQMSIMFGPLRNEQFSTLSQRNIARDFSDGVLCAEVVRHYFPNLVELHNYSPANSGDL